MPRSVFDYGEVVRARNTYTDPSNGTPVDPISVKVEIRAPDGTITTYIYGTNAQLAKVSVGVYQVLITLALTGTYKWRWTGTAADGATVDNDECDSERKF